MADVIGTNLNDALFFQGAWAQLTGTFTNPYSGDSFFIDEEKYVNITSYDGLNGFDSLFMTNFSDVLFLFTGGAQAFANIERVIAGDGADLILLAHPTVKLGDMLIDGGRSNDIIWGNAGNDELRGGDGDDILDGGPGNDLLLGQGGNDVLKGGTGNDILIGDLGDDYLDGGEGIDTVSYSATISPVYHGPPGGVNVNLATGIATGEGTDTLVNIENVVGSNFDDVITSNAADNVIDGGDGIDTVSYAYAAGGVVVNLLASTATGDGNDILISIENVIGSRFNDTIIGNNADNVISGGEGDDYLDGGAGVDTVSYALSATAVSVNLRLNSATGEGNDTLAGFENIIGSAFDDVLAGDAGNNVIDGGAGNDTVTYAAAAAGVTVNLATGAATGDGNDTLVRIENVAGSAFSDTLTGNAAANILAGGGGDDVLNGGAGADYLLGGAGNDTLLFSVDTVYDGGVLAMNLGSPGVGGTNEIYNARNTNGSYDVFDGGDGFDTLVLTSGADTLFLWDPYHAYHGAATGLRVISIERIDAGDGDDIVDFTSPDLAYGDLILNGGNGNDVLWTSSGNDTIDGGNGDDNIWGGLGNDILIGGAGNDILRGGPSAGAGTVSVVTLSHNFTNTVHFPDLRETVSIRSLVPSGENALGIAAGDLSVAYATTAQITFVSTEAGYHNTLGFYNVALDGTIGFANIAFTNVQAHAAGETATLTLPGAPDTDFGFFVIADGDSQNNFAGLDLAHGTLTFVYKFGTGEERLANIHDGAGDIRLVFTDGAAHKTVLAGDIWHTTFRDGAANLNSDGQVHVISGVVGTGDDSRLRIGFEDLRHIGDADYNDVVFDIHVNSVTTRTVLVNDSDMLYGGDGDDILIGGVGADHLWGGAGADRFVIDGLDGTADTIHDFSRSEGDVLDIAGVLHGYDPLHNAIQDFVRLVSSGGDTQVQVRDGDAFAAVAVIVGGVGGDTLADLIGAGSLVVA